MVRSCNNSKCLTGKEKIAADHYVVHGNKSDAYRAGYATAKMKALTVNRRAVEVFARPHVKAYVEYCQAAVTASIIFTRQDALEKLSQFALDEKNLIRDRISAIDRLSKMQGWDKAQKMDHGGVIFNINTTGKSSQ